MPTPKPPSKDATHPDAAAVTPSPAAAATDVGRTLIQTPGSQFSAFLAAPQSPEELGRLGGFRVLRLIGQGGMGFVFEGEDLRLERRVAIKVMRPEVAQQPDAAGRFLREARTAAALVSDHVVTIHHVDEQNGVPFLVMPLMAGETLHARMHREPISVPDSLRIGRECAQGLAAAHAAGLIHRDIKPANLWLEAGSGRVKILDFGLARTTSGSEITRSGQVLGTPQYMAPEQARGKVVDGRSDLFSLGAVLYRIATGKEAYSGDDVMAILTSLAVDDPVPPHEINPAIPARMSALISQLLAKDPQRRPSTAAAVVESLRTIEAGESRTVAEPLTGDVSAHRARRGRRLLIAAPAAVLAGAVLAFIARSQFNSPPPSTVADLPAIVIAKPDPPKSEPAKPVAAPIPPVAVKPPVLRIKKLAPAAVVALRFD